MVLAFSLVTIIYFKIIRPVQIRLLIKQKLHSANKLYNANGLILVCLYCRAEYYSPVATGLSFLDHSLQEPTYRFGVSIPACFIANNV